MGNDIEGITINVANDGTAAISFVPPIEYFDKLGSFDKDVKYLTDEQLSQAPGWAWLAASGYVSSDVVILFKNPDGISTPNIVNYIYPDNPTYVVDINNFSDEYGGQDVFFIPARFQCKDCPDNLTFKTTDGIWKYTSNEDSWTLDPLVASQNNFGDILCRPIPADYDGDGKDDMAVQCGATWKIEYSGNKEDLRVVELNDAIDPVPAYVYAGGIKYQDTVELYNYYKNQINCSPQQTCDIFDASPPIGPYFAQCVKYWAPNASYCWDK
ncbi:MAG: hypothetical protein HYT75_05275 [Deltaproteobacteria bacterium]|nr:hypothetical protein [Deltaproteobacteria bacterium]